MLKICALLEKDDIAIVTPTLGARRADQEVVDSVLPRRSYKAEIEVTTTFTGFGVGFGETWSVPRIVAAIRRDEVSKGKAKSTHDKSKVFCDEAAQVHFEQLDTAKEVGPRKNGNS